MADLVLLQTLDLFGNCIEMITLVEKIGVRKIHQGPELPLDAIQRGKVGIDAGLIGTPDQVQDFLQCTCNLRIQVGDLL